jgi:DNA-directed RNA polymerase subunit RPC12/RpoP
MKVAGARNVRETHFAGSIPGLMARYRCVFCRQESEGPKRKAPPCPKCGRMTVRIVRPTKVVLVDAWAEEP